MLRIDCTEKYQRIELWISLAADSDVEIEFYLFFSFFFIVINLQGSR